jgi:hypothetical protein
MNSLMFLEDEEIVKLSGRKLKGHQIIALRAMGIAFFVNATGHPVVTRAAVEGRRDAVDPVKRPWVPNVLKARHG